MASSSKLKKKQQKSQQPIDYFDLLPDDIVTLILNRVLDAKTLVRCLILSKRFAYLIPQTDVVSLPVFLPVRPTPTEHNAKPESILKSTVKSLIPKPLRHILSRRNRRRNSPCHCPPLLLRYFNSITHLHLDLHSHTRNISIEFLKWNATYGAEIKTCFVLCATSIRRGTVNEPDGDDGDDGETMPLVPNAELKPRILWTIWCLIAASARHSLLKKMLAQFPTLKTVVMTDVKRQGRLSMEEAEIGDLRDSLNPDGALVISAQERVVPAMRITMLYVAELGLPVAGSVLKGATLLVIGPKAHGEVQLPSAVDGVFDGDAAEKAIFDEAMREILKRKKKSTYVLETSSF